MPTHNLTTQWSAPIEVAAGDLLQLQSTGTVEIQNVAHAADPAAGRMSGYLSALPIEADKTLRCRMLRGSGTVAVIKGL